MVISARLLGCRILWEYEESREDRRPKVEILGRSTNGKTTGQRTRNRNAKHHFDVYKYEFLPHFEGGM